MGLNDEWISPSELDSIPKPRRTQISQSAKGVLATIGFVCLVTISVYGFLFYRGWSRHQEFEKVRTQGYTITGKVLDKTYVGGKGAHYRVTYDYQVGPQDFKNIGWVSPQEYQKLQLGNPIIILYLPSAPQISRLASERDSEPYKVFLFLPLVTLLAFFPLRQQIAKQKKLLEQGDPAPAVVSKVKRFKNGCTVFYSFRDGTGQEVQSKSVVSYQKAPAVGDRITILYLSSRSSESVVYPTSMVNLVKSTFQC